MDDPARHTGEDAEPTPPEGIDEAEEMARISESLSALIGRMAEFQKEMEPFLTLLAEPETDQGPADEEEPADRPE